MIRPDLVGVCNVTGDPIEQLADAVDAVFSPAAVFAAAMCAVWAQVKPAGQGEGPRPRRTRPVADLRAARDRIYGRHGLTHADVVRLFNGESSVLDL